MSRTKLKITLVKSGIGKKEDQKRTLTALGFKKLNQSVIKEDTPEVRGMINKINHLLHVEEIED